MTLNSELTLANFAAHVPALSGGNTPWAAGYARELRDIVVRQANRQPRSVQRALGPSEIGHECDRRIVGKLSGQPRTNNVTDPWPSVVGTAVHAWLADKFEIENKTNQVLRWVTEMKVFPHPRYPGTADLYDALTYSLVDHKVIGPSTLAEIQSADGPPLHYLVQLLLYAQGYRNLGVRVDRVVLAAWPRTAPTLDGMYCWERPWSPADDQLVAFWLHRTDLRRQVAEQVMARRIPIEAVPRTPGKSCFYCPLFRPQSARDGGPGCPGHSAPVQ